MKQIEEEDWKKGKLLGKGGFASVYVATSTPNHPFLPPVTAVKTAPMSEAFSPSSWLVREGNILSELQGTPYIIGFYGSSVSADQETEKTSFNLFLEYAAFGSLSHRIQEHAATLGFTSGLPELEVRHYTRSLLLGLMHIHQSNYVHCDLKPDNILLQLPSLLDLNSLFDNVVPKIADFGLAKVVGEPLQKGKGQLWGTPLYMAPESISFNEFEPPADIWALGCIVFEMLTGHRAWSCNANTSVPCLLDRIAYSNELPTIPSEVSTEARDFLSKCLVKDPTHRWTTHMLLSHPFIATDENLKGVSHDSTGEATMAVGWPPSPVDLCWLHQPQVVDLNSPKVQCSGFMKAMPNDAASTSTLTLLSLGNIYGMTFASKIDRPNKSCRGSTSPSMLLTLGLGNYDQTVSPSEIRSSKAWQSGLQWFMLSV